VSRKSTIAAKTCAGPLGGCAGFAMIAEIPSLAPDASLRS
jgi:hypothetical protein